MVVVLVRANYIVSASKIRTDQFLVVSFNSVKQAKVFEQFLNELSLDDHVLLAVAINCRLNEVHELLTASQYSRIFVVLYRQADTAKRYLKRWRFCSKFSNAKSSERDNPISEDNKIVA